MGIKQNELSNALRRNSYYSGYAFEKSRRLGGLPFSYINGSVMCSRHIYLTAVEMLKSRHYCKVTLISLHSTYIHVGDRHSVVSCQGKENDLLRTFCF
jgi:hypothetical protein